jgi:glucan 1,3-beta-glucosidase
MTIELCQAACKGSGYVYAGVEYAVECCMLFLPFSFLFLIFVNDLKYLSDALSGCDNAVRNGGGPAPDGSTQCNMACSGNTAEICGGPNRLDLYTFGF